MTGALDSTSGYGGVGLADDTAAISNDDWVDSMVRGVEDSLGWLSLAADPLAPVVELGVGWVIEQVGPLDDAIEVLTGSAGEVGGYAQAWAGIGELTALTAEQHNVAVAGTTEGLQGASADAYRGQADDDTAGLAAITVAVGGMVAAATQFGELVGGVRRIVTGLVGQCANIIPPGLAAWAAADGVTFGAATPGAVAWVVNLVTECANRIGRFLRALINSMENLLPLLRRLHEKLADLTRPRLAADGPDIFAMAKDKPPPDPIEGWLGRRRENEHECNSNKHVPTPTGYRKECSICSALQWEMFEAE